jgi:hypothetical protein
MGRRWGRERFAAPLTVAAAALLLLPASALAAAWVPVTGPTGTNEEVGWVRTPDGTLHVVSARNTPGSPSTSDIIHVAIAANGAVSAPSVIASAFASVRIPAIVNSPGGGLEVFFGAIQCTNQGCPIGLFTATSRDGGTTWTAPAALFDADQAYTSDMNAATLADGTPFVTWPHTTGVTVHRGLDPASPNFDYQGAMNAGCCGYQSNLAADAAGHVQLAWDSNATGFLGVWSRAVDPATGAPSGSPLLMPGSVTSVSGVPVHAQMSGARTPIVTAAGQFYVAYPAGYPSLTKVLLWRVGSPNSVTIVDEPQNHNAVALAADAQGRLWVFWAHGVSGGPHVFARRVSATGLEPVIDLGAPSKTSSIYALDGEVNSAGDPEALALVSVGNAPAGTYYAHGPQSAPVPPPVSGRSVDVSRVSGAVLIKSPRQTGFTPLNAGQQIAVGSTVDTTHGRVRLASAKSLRGGTQTADFYDGSFVVSQGRGKALTMLKLTGGSSTVCGRHTAGHGPLAQIARRRPRRHLWGSGRGSFGTSGTYATGTVRGTVWLTEDDCEGTLISVRRGTVAVRDLVRRKTVIVHAPHNYFAAR